MKNVEVVAGVIEFNHKILCMERDKGLHDYTSYKWEFPGGKMEQGESQEQTLIRELHEEMDMDIENLQFYCDNEYDYPDFHLTMHVFLCHAKSDKFNLNVHKDFCWKKSDELDTLEWAAADVAVAKKVQQDKLFL